jgi:hypothetical protein
MLSMPWRLVDDRFAGERRQLGDDLPPGLAANEDTPARSGISDAGADALAAPPLVRGQVVQVGTMPFTRVYDVKAGAADVGEHVLNRRDWRARQREVVPHGVDVSALAAEVRLHVDDEEHRIGGPQIAIPGPLIRPGIDETGRARRRQICRATCEGIRVRHG